MSEKAYFAGLVQKLLSRGLPYAYVQRIIDELRDHLGSAEGGVDKLGDTGNLADAFYESMVSRTVVGRRPFVSFFCLSFSLYFLKALLLFVCMRLFTRLHPDANAIVPTVFRLDDVNLVLSSLPMSMNLAAVVICCRVSRQCCLSNVWSLVACMTIILLSVLADISFACSMELDHLSFCIGFTLALNIAGISCLVAKAVPPLIAYALYVLVHAAMVIYKKKNIERIMV